MARKKIREFDAKQIICKRLNIPYQGVLADENINQFPEWLKTTRLAVKPDQLFGKRGKHNLVLLNADLEQVQEFIKTKLNQEITINNTADKLTHFLIEPYLEHQQEYYLSFVSEREQEVIYFSEEGGIDIEEKWHKTIKIEIPILEELDENKLVLIRNETTKEFIKQTYQIFHELNFTYLEFNPFIIKDNQIYLLDTVAKVDDCSEYWKDFPFPKPFGKKIYPEEEYIAKLDQNSGASLKLTILNPEGKIWNILSGGGASLMFMDALTNLGYGKEIANYGEYSGNPTEEESYQYAKTILNLMTKNYGKILLIGGAIANFTDVLKTFQGIARALRESQTQLQQNNIKMYVRRGGPNWQQGLQLIEKLGQEINVPIKIHGPDTNMTKITEEAVKEL